jgi:threonyl-tRNA synthetase
MLMFYGTHNRDAYVMRYEQETRLDTVRLVRGFEIHDYSQFTTAKESDSCRITVALVQEVGRPPLKLVQSKVPFLLLFSLVRKY